jgi:hypothetical protein
MTSKKKRVFQEIAQFVPVIVLASSFLVSGGVDLERAGLLFVVSALLAVIVTSVLIRQKVLLNPILVGTNLWLCIGALAFGIPIPAIAEILGQIQAAGLFACALGVGIVFTAVSATGYIGMSHTDGRVIRKLSVVMLVLTGVALVWSVLFEHNIRVGGGLPFILLNVTRRVLIRRHH